MANALGTPFVSDYVHGVSLSLAFTDLITFFLSLATIFMPVLWAGVPAPGPGGVAAPVPPLPVITGVRIKDLASVGGARFNQLTGYGLVFGLNNTGDKDPNYTTQAIANLLQRYGLKVDASKVKSKNAAAVMITEDCPEAEQLAAQYEDWPAEDVKLKACCCGNRAQCSEDRRRHRRKIPAYQVRKSKIARVRKRDIDEWFRSEGNESGGKGD